MARLLLRGGMAPVPEIVEEGVTGFVVGSIDEAGASGRADLRAKSRDLSPQV